MNTVKFFGHDVSKLIIGDNPFNGHSYIVDKTTGKGMTDFYTADKILETLFAIEKTGINAMLPLADPFIIRLLSEYERSGGKLQWIFQPYLPMNQEVSVRQIMGLHNTIGIYHQGTTTDFCYETGKCDEILERIKLYHTMGIPVGLGTHRPDVIEKSVREEWDVDFFVACMQNARYNREGEPSGFITGKTKAGLVFISSDRFAAYKVVQQVKKPFIAYKIVAGGQVFNNHTPDEYPAVAEKFIRETYENIKPGDVTCVGVFQRDTDQARGNAEIVRRVLKEKQEKEK